MSAETTLQAVLQADAGLTALVDTRIAENTAPGTWSTPFLLYAGKHETQLTLLGEDGERVTFDLIAWSATVAEAEAVSEAAKAALRAYNQAQTDIDVTILAEEPVSHEETGLQGRKLTVDWWPD